VNTSLLEQELGPLNTHIEQIGKKREELEGELRVVEAELETFSADRQRVDALRDVCNALDKLRELKADDLFWEGIPEAQIAAGHLERARGRIARFEGQISATLEKQASLQAQINQRLDELDSLYEQVRDAQDREERRQEEFVIEREISPTPYRAMLMPWTKGAESERCFRRAILVAFLICFVFGSLMYLVKVPLPDRSVTVVEIPERLVKLVKMEPTKPVRMPVPKQPQEEQKQFQEERKLAQEEPKPLKEEAKKPRSDRQKSDKPPKGGEQTKPEPTEVAAGGGGGGAQAARKKAEHVGILVFRNTLADLMNETPVARLGTEARLSKESQRVAGQAVAQRSLVAMQAQGGSSGGIGNAGISRNVGTGSVDGGGTGIGIGGGFGGGIGSGIGSGIGGGKGTGFARVESSIAGQGEGPRPLSDGPGPGRTDEEIQIVFDRYKAALYRIYNTELRKDPTLRGKMLLRISIETSGAVSMCKVESTDLASPELVANVVERIKRFNFGIKEGVPKLTILYPIDFLPAG
jgi:outer membrane biosynthesis protein TonB